MRNRVISALFLSLLLIGIASWSRFTSASKPQPNLAIIDTPKETSDTYRSLVDAYIVKPTTTSDTTKEPLSDTDLIGRKLISDYVDLATNGQATEENINLLANKYVEAIPTLNTPETVDLSEIQTVPNTKANFQTYGDSLIAIHKEYAGTINAANSSGTNLNILGPGLYSVSEIVSKAYATAASKLKKLSVPLVLVQYHTQLVNYYLSSAEAMNAIAKIDSDSAAAFAGIITINNNLNEEGTILAQITQILTTNGL